MDGTVFNPARVHMSVSERDLVIPFSVGELNQSSTMTVTQGITGTFSHDRLRNRDLPDQHPIGAITGLQDALDSMLCVTEEIVLYCGDASTLVTQEEAG